MANKGRGKNSLSTLERGFEILEMVEDLETATLTEIAEGMDIAVSTAHDYLTTLEELEYVVKHDSEYQLGLQFVRLGTHARASAPLIDIIPTYLKRVAEETGETVWFVVEEFGFGVYLDHEAGEQAIKTTHSIGGRSFLHCHAGGKAILAHLEEQRVNEIVEKHGLPSITENTISSRSELATELERIQSQGYAQNDEEQLDGTRSVSSAIVVDGEVFGAISVGGPAHRFTGEYFDEELPQEVMNVTSEIRLEVLYS